MVVVVVVGGKGRTGMFWVRTIGILCALVV